MTESQAERLIAALERIAAGLEGKENSPMPPGASTGSAPADCGCPPGWQRCDSLYCLRRLPTQLPFAVLP